MATREHQIVVGGFAQEGKLEPAWNSQREVGDVVERHRALGQLDPVERDQPDHLGKAYRDDDEVGAAHLERKAADRPAAQARHHRAEQHAEPDGLGVDRNLPVGEQVHGKAERGEARRVGADAEEGDVAEAELAGIAEQQIEAHGGNDEDAGHDEHVQDVEVVQPQRNGGQEQQPGDGEAVLHPIRSRVANRPVGLRMRMTMISRKPMASR